MAITLILHWQEANNLQKERKKCRFKKYYKERRDLKEKSKQRTLLRVKSYLSDLNSHLSTRPISQPDWPSYFMGVTKLDDSPFQTDDTGNSFMLTARKPRGPSARFFVLFILTMHAHTQSEGTQTDRKQYT